MRIVTDPQSLQKEIIQLKRQGKSIGFVPTMGNLHAGHLSLIEIAKQHADFVIASIFVNPMQFGPNEDFASYPRTMQSDMSQLQNRNTDLLFTPNIDAIYPAGKDVHTSVEVNRMTDKLCGASRPGHFKGVTTIVNILFNVVQPDVAVFGKKDFQQYLLIKTMVKDLMLPIQIIGGEILREENGLAMSSRNGYLSAKEKDQASLLRKVIEIAGQQALAGTDFLAIIQQAKRTLTEAGFIVDYFEIVRQSDLEPAQSCDKQLLIAAAAWLGKPRLIDNLQITLSP